MSTQYLPTELTQKSALNLFSAKSVKFWGLGGAALAGLMLFPHGAVGELMTGLSVLGMGTVLFWNRLNPKALPTIQRPERITAENLATLFTEIANHCNTIEAEAKLSNQANRSAQSIRESLAQLQSGCGRTQLNLVITGEAGVGKTTLLKTLIQTWLPQQTTPYTLTEQSWLGSIVPDSILRADLVLFIIQGDLTQSELNRIQALEAHYQPVIVILNKIDQFRAAELEGLTQKLSQVLDHTVDAADCLALAAAPQTITVRRHQEDGTVQELQEQPAPQLGSLTQRFAQRLTPEGRQQLVLQQVYAEAMQLRDTGLRSLNVIRRQRALPLVEKYQWLSASAAFASPLPSTDMIAAAAITGKLVTDLGEIYDHRFSLGEAQNIAAILANALLKLGLVELSSQLLGVALKSHAATYVAGGLIQGLSVAYLTHIAGLSLIEHFEAIALQGEASESQFSLQKMKQIVERVFADNQRVDVLKGWISQGVSHLQPAH
jgi:uncharacterized protein